MTINQFPKYSLRLKTILNSDKLDVIDYVILACIKNGVKKYTSIFKNCKKTNAGKFREHVNELEDMGLITIDSSESWFTRNTNPSIILKKDGIKFVEVNKTKVEEHWNVQMKDSK